MEHNDSIPRSRLSSRRVRYVLTTAILGVLFAYVCVTLNENLWNSSYFTGYVLLGSIVFLTAFNLRKRFTFLPGIGTAAMWMQLHIYVGLSTFLIFGFHVGWKVPNGMLEGFLGLLYMIVALSGVYGLLITRVIPKRLTAVGQEIVFEKIPAMRIQVADDARQTALGSLGDSDVIAKYYLKQLLPFFERPRGMAYFVFPNGRRKRRLIGELTALDRYLSQPQRQVGQQLSGLVKQKDDLDYHQAMQGRLKLWLFLHIGFTYSLLAISILHAILVHAFIGGGL